MTKEEMFEQAVEEAKKEAKQAEAENNETMEEEDIMDIDIEKMMEELSEDRNQEEIEEEVQEEEKDTKKERKSKRRFSKDKKDKKDEEIETLKDRLVRQMAEFDNFRKRTDKEKSQMYEIGAKDVIEKMLQVVDNFERGLSVLTEEEKQSPFAEGMDMIYKQLMTTLEGLEVKPIEATGQVFDPELHNAVMHIEDEALEENTIAEEFQKGYTYRGGVVRHSMVKVAN